MNDQQQATQRTLFARQLPEWLALPPKVQQAALEALSQMLLEAVAPESSSDASTTPAQEIKS
ncbi:MAG: hypothetical protein QF805_19235 [Pirellulaceae bacterium]|jgi:hypothetical protein|nr:hypothetical protein [Pirellulaceae bacterium]